MSSVLVVHAIDTEGPLGGDARRLPDGTPEFFDTWAAILDSLRELTDPAWRGAHCDSLGAPYRFSWFIMDFTGFRTNPKHRVAAYHDTWDQIHTLPIDGDGLYWHYHTPPDSGVGDEWSPTWLTSNEANTILARRLLERGSFPGAFRAGGTIEDDAASEWLERAVPIDFSNRVSERSHPEADLYRFNWYGAPSVWGSYHPARSGFLRPGTMRRFVYRSLDLRSRYNELELGHVEACFANVRRSGKPRVLSYFSHDNRDMRPETAYAYELLTQAADRTGVPWESCTAIEAHRRYHGLEAAPIPLRLVPGDDELLVAAGREPLQHEPFVAAELKDGRFVRLVPVEAGSLRWRVGVPRNSWRRVAAAVTSTDGSVTIAAA